MVAKLASRERALARARSVRPVRRARGAGLAHLAGPSLAQIKFSTRTQIGANPEGQTRRSLT